MAVSMLKSAFRLEIQQLKLVGTLVKGEKSLRPTIFSHDHNLYLEDERLRKIRAFTVFTQHRHPRSIAIVTFIYQKARLSPRESFWGSHV